ncbi:MAG: GNAT family N-acetyltransferase [Candidatus Kariarchaeaceae archaeon]|jgi:predicted GNAT family acetyltransferase
MIARDHEIIGLQQTAANAWPGKYHIFQNGWIIRLTSGIHQRANSVLPVYYSGINIREDIGKVEEFYHRYNIKSIFQVAEYCEPMELDTILDEIGYEKVSSTVVMTIEIEKIQETLSMHFTPKEGWYPSLTEDASEWLNSVYLFGDFSKPKINEKQIIINNIKREKHLFTVNTDDEEAAVALAVVEDSTMGIFEVAVKPSLRLQGMGMALMLHLLSWAKSNDIRRMYLQVENSNVPAKLLYANLGFEEKYHYHYRELEPKQLFTKD